MIQLMKLELYKNKLRGTIIAFISITFSVCGILLYGNHTLLSEDGEYMITSTDEMYLSVFVIYRLCFVIFAGVLIARYVIDEFSNGTIRTLFTYPIPRRKIMTGKLLLVFIITVISYILANIFSLLCFVLLNPWLRLVPDVLTYSMVAGKVPLILFDGLAVGGISLLALFFGMIKKSSVHTIVAATIISLVLNGNWGSRSTLFDLAFVPILFCLLGILTVIFTCKNINRTDF